MFIGARHLIHPGHAKLNGADFSVTTSGSCCDDPVERGSSHVKGYVWCHLAGYAWMGGWLVLYRFTFCLHLVSVGAPQLACRTMKTKWRNGGLQRKNRIPDEPSGIVGILHTSALVRHHWTNNFSGSSWKTEHDTRL